MYDRFNITGGLRWEDNDQRVNTFTLNNSTTTARLNRVDMLPSAVATLFLPLSSSCARVSFRELSSAPFTDIDINQETVGNPNLKQTAIKGDEVTRVFRRGRFFILSARLTY